MKTAKRDRAEVIVILAVFYTIVMLATYNTRAITAKPAKPPVSRCDTTAYLCIGR